jgi:hypothetical protein
MWRYIPQRPMSVPEACDLGRGHGDFTTIRTMQHDQRYRCNE